MTVIQDMIRETLEEEGNEDLLDYISEGDGEAIDDVEEPLSLDDSFPSTLFICNLPQVGQEKYQRLMKVVGKPIDLFGQNEKYMPMNETTQTTDGFMIVTYETTEGATRALPVLDGYKLANITLKAVRMDDFEQIVSRREKFEPRRELSHFSRAAFRDWLGDEKGREQILLRHHTETEIYWHDPMAGMPILCYGGEREKAMKKVWCDWTVKWSPWGSVLATFHQQGIAIWAGPTNSSNEFTKKNRFPHENVKFIEFSPNEEFLLTWNGSLASEDDKQAVRIFCVLTGQKMKELRTPGVAPLGGEFPHVLWSHDGKYFAEAASDGTISIRDTETFTLIKDEAGKKKNLKYDGLHTFQWSPKDNTIAVWTLEKDNNPARLVLVQIPSRVELASRSRTQVEASMHWQSEGDYLCLLVTKILSKKTNKKGATNLELFRIRERNIPVDIVEVRDTVRGFYWETKGNRFAVLTTDDAGTRPKLLMYALGREKCENVASLDLPSNSFNNFFWAPDGQYFVCAAIGHGDLLFGGLTPDNKLEILHKEEHFMLTEVQWDPSSRYVITAVTQPMQNETGGFRYSMEAGYAVWTFQGRLLHRAQKEKLFQVSWRPHPPSMLSPERQKDIRKNIKTFSKRYDALDDQLKEAARSAFREERQQKTSEFQSVLDRLEEFKDQRMEENGWGEAWEKLQEDQGWVKNQVTHEEDLDITEELISSS
mmetsp:Transcript_67936/g.147975  ORF Transcript_67936/g.147975 Transcript_67936/m.147975 type:complete len:709 (-) Transcript_67936:76-2202(-)